MPERTLIDIDQAWPVGAIYLSVSPTNPGTTFGFGTWEAFGAGRMPVGHDGGDADFDTAEETGGAKTTTLTTAELPAHSHAITDPGHTHDVTDPGHTHVQDSHNHTQNAHSHVITSQTATTGSATSYEHGTLDTSSAETEATEVTATATATNQAATATNQSATTGASVDSGSTGITGTGSSGSGAAFSRMPPYIVVHMWKRTA